MNPKLPGQVTSHFNKFSWWIQANQKVYHVECDRGFAKDIQHLMQYAKELDLVTKYWGCHAHVSKVGDKSSLPSKIKCLIQVAQRHTNYQCSMILEDIAGIVDLNGSAAVKDEETGCKIMTITLCTVLLKSSADCGDSSVEGTYGPCTGHCPQHSQGGAYDCYDEQEFSVLCW
jgi:hypothetical protein